MASATFYIPAGADDGHCITNSTGFNSSQISFYLGNSSGNSYRAFCRFTNVTIPSNAIVTNAFVRVTAVTSYFGSTVNVNCYLNDADNAARPTTAAGLMGLSLTDAVAWNNVPNFTNEVQYDSPDISSIVQDVIDRSGWSSGNAMTVVFEDNGSTSSQFRGCSSYDLDSGNEKAELHITYDIVTAQETIAVTENIAAVLSFSGSLPDSTEDIGVEENISVDLFEAWRQASATEQIALSESITAELEILPLASATEEVRVTENVSIELEVPAFTSISETLAVTENVNIAFLQNVNSGGEDLSVTEYLKAALDIPTDWVALANAGLTIERYYFTLTGDADETTDIEIPISSFQARKRTGEATYLSVVIRDYATYASEVTARSNGDMVVEMNYSYDGEESIRQEILRAELEDIRLYEGPQNRSIILVGHKTQTFANRSVTMENPIYKATVEARITYRFAKCDPYLNPGDTLVVGDDSLTVDYITYIVSSDYKAMEVREIG